jgi:hypothetical protein
VMSSTITVVSNTINVSANITEASDDVIANATIKVATNAAIYEVGDVLSSFVHVDVGLYQPDKDYIIKIGKDNRVGVINTENRKVAVLKETRTGVIYLEDRSIVLSNTGRVGGV